MADLTQGRKTLPPELQKKPELGEDLTNLLNGFSPTPDKLETFRDVALGLLGEEWREILPEAAERAGLKGKAVQLLSYDKAVKAWEDAANLLSEETPDPEAIKRNLDRHGKWLADYFGEAGEDLFSRLQSRWHNMGGEEEARESRRGVPAVDLWNFDHFMRLERYYEETLYRTSARCVRMGNISLDRYPHYAYVIDVLQELVDLGEAVLESGNLSALMEETFENGQKDMESLMEDLRTELEQHAEPLGTRRSENTMDKDVFIEKMGGFVDDEKPKAVSAGEAAKKRRVLKKIPKGKKVRRPAPEKTPPTGGEAEGGS